MLTLAACASPTPYQPAVDGYGFAEQRLEANRFRVSFAGNSVTDRTTVENYLLYRAAEVTLANGCDFFVVAERDTEPTTRYYGNSGWGGGFGWGGGGYGRRTSVFTGIGVSTAEPSTRYQAFADILLFVGTKPGSDPKAYDARDTLRALGPAIHRPVPPS